MRKNLNLETISNLVGTLVLLQASLVKCLSRDIVRSLYVKSNLWGAIARENAALQPNPYQATGDLEF